MAGSFAALDELVRRMAADGVFGKRTLVRVEDADELAPSGRAPRDVPPSPRCASCGLCCLNAPGQFFPADLGATPAERTERARGLIWSGLFSIDWWEEAPGHIFFLRPATQRGAGRVFDPSHGGACVLLGPGGCTLPRAERPPDRSGDGRCRWCGEIVWHRSGKREGTINKRSHWHPECLHDFYLHSRLEEQFAHVEHRDGLKCAWPGCGASPERWYSPRIDVVSSVGPPFPWTGRRDGEAYWTALFEFRREHWHRVVYWEVERRTALELDHRIPLWAVQQIEDLARRRRFYGPANLWLLCPEHHKAKTAREAALRAEAKRTGMMPDLRFLAAEAHLINSA